MTDEIERVRELYEEASREVYRRGLCGTSYDTQMIALLAKRLQPKPTPAPKVWSVSEGTAERYITAYGERPSVESTLASRIAALNAIVDDIIRDRPDAVAKDWERRYREAMHRKGCVFVEAAVADCRRDLFSEVEG